MTRCNRSGLVQEFLDGELSTADATAFRAHLSGCPDCAVEVALFQRVFLTLETAPILEPPVGLEDRILERVLPSRVRRRRLVALGWSYASALAACIGGMGVWLARSGNQEMLGSLTAQAVRWALGVGLSALNLLGSSTVGLVEGWRWLLLLGQHFAPLSRAMGAVLAQAQVAVALGGATAVCIMLLWWMRSRPAVREVRRVGILGF